MGRGGKRAGGLDLPTRKSRLTTAGRISSVFMDNH